MTQQLCYYSNVILRVLYAICCDEENKLFFLAIIRKIILLLGLTAVKLSDEQFFF